MINFIFGRRMVQVPQLVSSRVPRCFVLHHVPAAKDNGNFFIRQFGSSKRKNTKSSNNRRGGGGGRRQNNEGKKNKKKKNSREKTNKDHQTIHRPNMRSLRRKDYFENNKLDISPTTKSETIIPPALLVPTGSKNVFVAQTALGNNYREDDDDEEEEIIVDPSTLFVESHSRPSLFLKNEFEYLSPTDLKYEYPKHGKPEVAFLGRSNVGKSSLVNALMNKKLCITSKSPGRTQLPYYYGLFPNKQQKPKHQSNTSSSSSSSSSSYFPSVSDAIGYIIDLPGYGYAAAPQEKVEEWQAATQDLLLDRRHVLQRVFLLVDTRRDGLTDFDMLVIKWLEEEGQIPFSVVLTKCDRTSIPQIIKQVNQLCLRYSSQQALLDDEEDVLLLSPIFHVTSSKDKSGINELLLSIEAEFLGEEEEVDNDYHASDL